MMKKYHIILFLFNVLILWGQKDDKLIFFPQSPEVQTFQKHIDQPVSLHNGTVDVSIPLYNIPIGKHIIFPLSLSYNTSGIKVNEKSGSVGLGWSISNPGVIIRNTRGEADNIVSLQGAYEDLKNNIYNVPLIGANPFTDDNILEPRLSGDYEPDEYSVSFFGENFRLVFDGSIAGENLGEKFVQMPLTQNKVKARLSNGVIIGWEIIDIKGNTYYFGSLTGEENTALEIQSPSTIFSFGSPSSSQNSSSGIYTKAWYLIKISTPENTNEAKFIYKSKGQSTIPNFIGETSYACPRIFTGTHAENLTMTELCNSQSIPVTSFSYSIENNEDFLIDEILTNSTRVKFNHLGARNDLIGSKSLSNIEVFTNNTNPLLVKKIDFNYSYFTSQETEMTDCALSKLGQTILSSYISSQSLRLKLDSVSESFTSLPYSPVLTHSFEYESDFLPNTMSFAQDHWGYYNGKHSNCGLLPNLALNIDVGSYLIGKNERAVNESYSKYGILKKIKYPTGGSINFIFEKNEVSSFLNNHENFISLNPYRTIDLSAEQSIDENNNIVNLDLDLNLQFSFNNLIELTQFEKEFNPEGRAYYNNLYIESTSDPTFEKRLLATGPNHRYVNLKKNETYKVTCTLDTGAFYDSIGNPYFPNYGFKMSIGYRDYDPSNIAKLNGGGLRISKIILKDSNNEIISMKEYDYQNSGVGINQPLYVDPFYISDHGIKEYPIFKLYGLSQMPNRSLISSNAYYDKVSVFRTNIFDGNQTKTDFHYNPISEVEALPEIYESNSVNQRIQFRIPLRTPIASWRIGKLKKQIDYDLNLNTNTYTPIISVEYVYSIIKNYYHRNIFGFRFEKKGSIMPPPSYNPVPHNVYDWEFYPLYTENFDIINTRIYDFFKNGNSILKETNYYYNSTHHDFLTKEEIISPDTIQETTYKYASEFTSTDVIATDMVAANMIGIPLQTETIKNGISISKTKTTYGKNANTSNLILPISVTTKNLDSGGMESQVTYDQYDSKGNLLQYTIKSDVPTAIIWGYNQTQPIAKIEGATYAQVSGLAAAIISASNDDANDAVVGNPKEQDLLIALDAFRTNSALSGYQITTYSYDPLIGVRSITPPSGIREVYIYDTANRLKEVKDINGNILKEYQYHYKP